MDRRPKRRKDSVPRVAETAAPPLARGPTDSSAQRAKLFWNGRSQAVRLPKEFRFDGDEVTIRREGERVILEPVRKRGWPLRYWERLDQLTRDFEFPECEPLGGRLLDVSLDDDS